MARLSGTWTLRAIEKEAGWRQGILISGSTSHDGVHEMVVGTEIHSVQGDEITLTPQAFDPAVGTWIAPRPSGSEINSPSRTRHSGDAA